jgi:hypothetical protein
MVDVNKLPTAPTIVELPAPPDTSPAALADAKSKHRPKEEMTLEMMVRNLKKNTHIYLAVPCYNCRMRHEFVTSLMQLQALAIKFGIQLSVEFMGNESLIQRGRSILAGRFLTTPATHLLFIDADIAFNPATVFRLALRDKGIAAAVYPKKNINWSLVRDKQSKGVDEDIRSAGVDFNINVAGETKIEDGFIRVLDAATGFFMIRRDALEKLNAHYGDELRCENDIPGSKETVPEYVALFDCFVDPSTRRYLSEDYALCRRAQAIGIEIWADVASPLTHVGMMSFEGHIAQRFEIEMRYMK